ncbi:hypothetical protein FOA52_012883 [Chlamydomonas sp. UWO 241]|nr:hypothetical protein FOA52_012883 [Chlamydomonas sp. UWO 241]
MSASRSADALLRLIPSARQSLHNVLASQRQTLWGTTELKLRVRKYPKSGEERVSLVKPQTATVKLYSHVLEKFVPLKMSAQMLRTVENSGGLDEYLLSTPDSALHSDVASTLRWQVMCRAQEQAAAKAKGAQGGGSAGTGAASGGTSA